MKRNLIFPFFFLEISGVVNGLKGKNLTPYFQFFLKIFINLRKVAQNRFGLQSFIQYCSTEIRMTSPLQKKNR